MICGVMAERGEPCKEVLFRVRELGRVGKLCFQRIVRAGLVEKVIREQKSDCCQGGNMGRPGGREPQRERASPEALRCTSLEHLRISYQSRMAGQNRRSGEPVRHVMG